ncbi:MAG: DUF3500 domain-containing protein [Planctomycetales bacterium]|nr:DUF3500 domain-containing protein [Planctomycetales bacterium]
MTNRHELSRRHFVQASAAAGAGIWLGAGATRAVANPTRESKAEVAVKEFYSTLSDSQKEKICFPFEHEKRKRINANWGVTDPEIGSDFYTKAQRETIKNVLKQITSEEGYERFLKQMEEDAGGWDAYHVGVFGDPNSSLFQFLLTGRHITLRADGDSVPGYAFGGAVIYGHGEEDPSENIYHYQTKQANKVFGALNEDQRAKAMVEKAPRENAVELQGAKGQFTGVSVSTFSDDQKQLVKETIDVMLAPYRKEDRDEVHTMLEHNGGIEQLHMTYYRQGDLKNDKVWDIWRVEGPALVWHFRGAPHAHTYLNIGQKQG